MQGAKEMSGHDKGRVKSIPKADRGIGKRVLQIVLKMSGNSYNLASVSRLLSTVSKIMRDVRLKFRLRISQKATKNSDRGGVF